MIRIRNLWKRFGSIDVLKGLCLEALDGEILVILGRSGVGKSVLLRHIIGIEKPDQGTVEVDGIEITGCKKNEFYHTVRHMGMLFQGAALFDSMTVEENIAFYLMQHGDPITGKSIPKEEIRQRVEEVLGKVGLEGVGKKMPSELSGGMKKRAAIARLIVYRPSIRLYDEPTTGLDPITAQQINELIVSTQEDLKGLSIVVTHDIHSALYIADRLALHRDGKLVNIAKPEEFLQINDPLVHFLKQNIISRKGQR